MIKIKKIMKKMNFQKHQQKLTIFTLKIQKKIT